MASVVFNYAEWSARYPELAPSVNSTLAGLYFTEACLYLDNGDNSPIPDATTGGPRDMLLNMITAHIAALNAPLNGQASSALVGRISQASQGSVSVSTDMSLPAQAAWFAQTKYGAAFWQATAQLRTMQYRRRQRPIRNPGARGAYGRLGW